MREKFRIGVGIFSLLIGIFLVLDSFSGITGHVVSEQTGRGIGSVLGLVFIIGGLLLLALEVQERRKEGGLVRVIRTRRFEKAIKRHPKKPIEDAIAKLGTGLAHEEPLKYMEGWSIRAQGGGRIMFGYNQAKTEATLNDYRPPSRHY